MVVARELREAILEGTLAPDERIKQDAVAKQFGVSRLPVREALRELAGEGLVTLERDVGAKVTLLDPRELVEIYLMREVLEPMMIAHATELISEEDLAAVRELDRIGKDCVEREDVAQFLQNDRDFHTALISAARMPRAQSTVRNLWQTAERYRRTYTKIFANRLDVSVVEHEMIVDAMERRAPDDAAEIYRIHVRRTRIALSEHSELFPPGAAS